MKKSMLRKVLLLACSAVLLVCLSVGATLAYLTSQTEEVKNTFTVGKVAITLDEAAIEEDEKTGNWVEDSDATRVKTNAYHLMPGLTYAKDPTVTVIADSEPSYVRILVTINKIDKLMEIFPDSYNEELGIFMLEDFVGDTWNSTVWPCNSVTANTDGTYTYEFRHNGIVTTEASKNNVLPDLFEKIVVPGDVTNAQLADLDGLNIKVVAQAIQAAGFSDADAAWKEFKAPAVSTPGTEDAENGTEGA